MSSLQRGLGRCQRTYVAVKVHDGNLAPVVGGGSQGREGRCVVAAKSHYSRHGGAVSVRGRP